MIILGDSQITNATIEGTNVLSFADEENLKVYQLSEKLKTTSGITKIILDFGSNDVDISAFALCGTNISSGATVSLCYSGTDITTPEETIPLPQFTNFNQVWIFDTVIQKRYWCVDISDPDPQDASALELGFIYVGEYTQIGSVGFPHSPSLNIASNPSVSATGQGYGSKGYTARSIEFTAYEDKDGIEDIFSIVKSKQNIDPVLLIPFEDSLDNTLYPPMYCALTSDSYAYPMDGDASAYALNITATERF